MTTRTKLVANTFGEIGKGSSIPETAKVDQHIPLVPAKGEIDDDPR